MKLNSTTLYQRLSNEEDARACTGISDSACREVPGNFFKILIAQLSTKLADSFTSSKIVLPWLLTSAGAPAFFMALLVPIRESGSLIPQLILGGVVRQFQHRKQFYVIGSLLQGALCRFDGYLSSSVHRRQARLDDYGVTDHFLT